MSDRIEEVRSQALQAVASAENLDQLNQIRVQYLGKKGLIQDMMKALKDLPK